MYCDGNKSKVGDTVLQQGSGRTGEVTSEPGSVNGQEHVYVKWPTPGSHGGVPAFRAPIFEATEALTLVSRKTP